MAEIVSHLVLKLVEYMAKVGAEKIIAPLFGRRNKLNQLKGTMEFIQARLADAESRRESEDGAAAVKLLLKRLKGVLYKLEDLFEEVSMADVDRARAAETMFITKPVCVLKLETHRLMLNYKVSQDVENIMSELETIKSDMSLLNLRVGFTAEVPAFEPMNWRETHSFVSEEEVIGRKNDRDVIVEMLLSSHYDQGDQSLSVIPIVGIGGLGKTTLAQLCFNDEKVKQRFELKVWTCISESSSLKDFVRLIHDALRCGNRHGEKISLEELQSCLQEHINGKRFLIVLDDVWNEDAETWLKLKPLLSCGKQGSRILVTTRSTIAVGKLMGTVEPYQLKALSEEESWALFESLAFDKRPHERDDSRLISIGRQIVKKCVNVPLATRTIASLLRSKHTEEEWARFVDKELRFIEQNGKGTNAIMSTLKLSYDHLHPQLKQCFAYCSLFPKDYKLDKQQLIWLWMAQGFLGQPLGDGIGNPEYVGHEYFMELLERCFFQDVRRNEFGMIVGCKMHDLFHDLACKVGDDQLLLIEGHVQDDSIRHLSFVGQTDTLERDAPFSLHTANQLRSLLYVDSIHSWCISKSTILSLRHIRALHLTNLISLGSLRNSIGKLKHLRYLAIQTSSKSLRSGITGLQNLQTLDLLGSSQLRKLPKGFHKLFNLRHLRIGDGNALYGRSFPDLIEMPLKFEELTSLQTLDTFIVGNNNGLDALGGMNNLAGELLVCFRKHRQNFLSEASRANLKGKKLTSLGLNWSFLGDEPTADAEKELAYLQLPSSLKELHVEGWKGVRFPGWEKDGSLGYLISLQIENCEQCRHLPCLSRLLHLKLLKLKGLYALEYIEDKHGVDSCQNIYFPSLEDLELRGLPNLKGWSRAEVDDADNNIRGGARHEEDENYLHLHTFSRLSELRIDGCNKLMTMPQAPRLQSLIAENIQGRLLNQLLMTQEEAVAGTSSCVLELKELSITSIDGLDSLSIDFSNSLHTLCVRHCSELASLSAESKSSLRNLELKWCSRLKDITSVLRQLPVLERLVISGCDCDKLDLREVGSECQIGWQGLENLKHLRIEKCHKLTSLPYLPCGLTQLYISDCDELAAMPPPSLGLGNLTQLQNLKFGGCPGLRPYIESSFGDHLSCLTMLVTLIIGHFSFLATLPESIGHLPHLRHLQILDCPQLRAIPASFRNLSGLQFLRIYECPHLSTRCKPRGEDWPLIQHILCIEIDSTLVFSTRDCQPVKNLMSRCYC